MFLRLEGGGLRLQEFPVGIGLQFDQIRRGNDLLDLSEVDAFNSFRWHFNLWSISGPGQVLV